MGNTRYVLGILGSLALAACNGAEQASLLSDVGGSDAPACDEMASPFGGGAGTTEAPYLICSVAHLQAVTSPNHTQHFKMMADVDLGAITDYPSQSQFSGTFDGDGYTIKNLTQTGADTGIWSSINGTVKNLRLTNVDITGAGSLGALAKNTTVLGVIEEVHLRGGDVVGTGSGNGAIVGSLYGVLRNSTSNVDVEGDDNIGGLVGVTYGTIEGSDSSGSIVGDLRLGRITGSMSSGTIRNCSYSGFVSYNFQVTGLVSGTVDNCN